MEQAGQSSISQAFEPVKVGPIILKNRFVKAATYEGMTPNGIPNTKLIDFHSNIAKGGIAMTTIAYSAVSNKGRTHQDQLWLNAKSAPMLERLVNKVHNANCLTSIQLTHCGFFSAYNSFNGRPIAPSKSLNFYGLLSGKPMSRPMAQKDREEVLNDFRVAAKLASEIGFDCIELHMGHGYLLSQFLSPLLNKRKDNFGGDLNRRLRFPIEVLTEIKTAAGTETAIIVKMNVNDGIAGGVSNEEAKQISLHLESSGADAIIPSGGITSRNAFYLLRGDVPQAKMAKAQKNMAFTIGMQLFGKALMKSYPFVENFFQEQSSKIQESLKIPVGYLGGAVSTNGIRSLLDQGFDFIVLGRALINDPEFIHKLDAGYVSPCNHCNECLVEMDKGGVKCVL